MTHGENESAARPAFGNNLMDKADAMYGVSMDAQGISHIFSVRPRHLAEERRQAAGVIRE